MISMFWKCLSLHPVLQSSIPPISMPNSSVRTNQGMWQMLRMFLSSFAASGALILFSGCQMMCAGNKLASLALRRGEKKLTVPLLCLYRWSKWVDVSNAIFQNWYVFSKKIISFLFTSVSLFMSKPNFKVLFFWCNQWLNGYELYTSLTPLYSMAS